jgi:hypothetical protein
MKAGPRLISNLFCSSILIALAVTVVDAKDRGAQTGDKRSGSAGAGVDTGAAKKSTGVVQTGPIVRDHSGSGDTPAPTGFTAEPPRNTGRGTVRDHTTPWMPPGHPCHRPDAPGC